MEEQNYKGFENNEDILSTPHTKKLKIPKKVIVISAIALSVIAISVILILLLGSKSKDSCQTTGIHTYKSGMCTDCGLKVFDVIKEYCVTNGEPNLVNQTLIRLGSHEDDKYYVRIFCNTADNSISICCYHNQFHNYWIDLQLTPYVFEDGGYEWTAGCGEWNCDCPSISGFLDPTKFSSNTSCITYTSSESGANNIAKYGTWALQHAIEEYLIDFLNEVGHDITIGDLGFKRYEE